ncbi:MAG: response regulator [Limisphaerales bacterium]
MKERILVVDDEALMRDFLENLLRRHGFDVTVAATAAEAFQAVDEVPLHLVILDIALEDADGLEVLATIRQAHPRLPVVMLTGMGFDDELEGEALRKGAQGYLSKLLPFDQLLLQVRRMLKQADVEGQATYRETKEKA